MNRIERNIYVCRFLASIYFYFHLHSILN